MTREEAVKVLRNHNDWRRSGYAQQYTAKEVGEAIDMAIAALSPRLKPTLENIAAAVTEETGIALNLLRAEERTLYLVEARWMVMWLGREYTGATNAEIAAFLNRKTHGTVIHGYCMASERMRDPRISPLWVIKVKRIQAQIENYLRDLTDNN